MRTLISTDAAPGSSSPVSQATMGGGLIFVGGQMPLDPATGRMAQGALAQAQMSLRHGLAILEAAGSGRDKVMLATVYMTDLAAKPDVNTAFEEMFGSTPPARNLVEVSAIGADAIVEVALIALA